MAAKKGIRARVIEWWTAHPADILFGRQIEDMYREFGGAVNGPNYPRSRRGRVAQDTVKRFIDGLISDGLVRRLAEGTSVRSSWRRYFESATFAFIVPLLVFPSSSVVSRP